MNEHIEKSQGTAFTSLEEAISHYEEHFSPDLLVERLNAIEAIQSDDSEAVHEVLTEIAKILKASTISVLDNNGNPADVMLCYGTESNIPKEQWDEYGREFGARVHRFDPARFIGTLKGGLEDSGNYADFVRVEVANKIMPKAVAEAITRILSL